MTHGIYVKEEQGTKRELIYGNLMIDRERSLVIYHGNEVALGPYEIDVLVYLLEHMGKAVSRSEINQTLPERKRENERNIDTHIKNIRRCLNLKDVIVSVRSVGYRIDPDKFYQWTRK